MSKSFRVIARVKSDEKVDVLHKRVQTAVEDMPVIYEGSGVMVIGEPGVSVLKEVEIDAICANIHEMGQVFRDSFEKAGVLDSVISYQVHESPGLEII